MATATPEPSTPARPRRTLVFLLPLLVFAGLGVFLALGLGRDPGALPSTLVGKPAPAVDLPPIPGRDEAGLKSADLRGRPMLVNVFASWCVPCRVEAPVLDRLKEEGVTIQGIDYKDPPADVTAWLKDLGDPSPRSASTAKARPRSTGASTACRRPSSSIATGAWPTSSSGRSSRRTWSGR